MLTFYNSNGNAIAYISDDNQSIYLYNGTPVAWLSGENIYAYNGKYLGWIQDGWVFDRNGTRAFFTENASGGPIKPVKAVRPVKGVRDVRPVRSVRETRPARPVRSLNWSQLSNNDYFNQ